MVEGVAAVWAKLPNDIDPIDRGTHPSSVVNRQSDKDIGIWCLAVLPDPIHSAKYVSEPAFVGAQQAPTQEPLPARTGGLAAFWASFERSGGSP